MASMRQSSSKPAPTKAVPSASAVSGQTADPRVARGTGVHPQVLPHEAGMFTEPFLRRWLRRSVTIPGVFAITGIYVAAMPILVSYGAIRDVLRGRRSLPLVRFHFFITGILAHHCFGLVVLAGSWWVSRFMSIERRRQLNLDIEIFYIPQAIAIAEKVYGMDIEIDNVECCAPGPILLLSRHASILDTIMPIKILGQALGMGMRIVQKDQLLWNPIVDVASSRMCRAFVTRGSGKVEGPITAMKHLMRGITDNEAMVVFPEGSRFSESKKQHIVDKLSKTNAAAAERAKELEHLLPIRPAGTLALLSERPDMDVVFMAHTGLEGANRLEDFVAGALRHRKLRMKFWRVSADEIPSSAEDREQWLHTEWLKVDAWIDANREA